MKHTPGPWHPTAGTEIISDTDLSIAMLNVRRDEWTENAHLIAAAPEMYEELHTVSDWLATVAGEMDCTAGNFDGGSAASCEHCLWKQALARIDALLLRASGD